MGSLSLHIGLNAVDPRHYIDELGRPWDGRLLGCENDARGMASLAQALGYTTTTLLTTEATAGAIQAAFARLAPAAKDGDSVLITFSGHGGQVIDETRDEWDWRDETWVTFDRMLLDDEIRAGLSKFGPGVGVVVVSDSCHSGTVVKAFYDGLTANPAYLRFPANRRSKAIPARVERATVAAHADLYRAVLEEAGAREPAAAEASVLLLAACEDWQTASDGTPNGVFTGALLKIWGNGSFTGTYEDLRAAIAIETPTQTPELYPVDESTTALRATRPFGPAADPIEPPPSPPPATPPGTNPVPAPTEPATTPIPLEPVVLVLLVLLTGLAVLAFVVINSGVPVPIIDKEATPVDVATQGAEFLIRWGIVLVVIAFVPFVVISTLAAFSYPAPKQQPAVARKDISEVVQAYITALPGLLARPIGVGMAMVLLGVIFLLGVVITTEATGDPGEVPISSPSASESVAPAASPSESLAPGPSASESAQPSPSSR